ncbi:MAG: Gfo/Idh/MocA family oxidoreductase, partial [Rhodospirillales bacterium]
MSEKLRVGIAGYGIVGKRRRDIIDGRDDMRTVAVCDRTLGGSGQFDDGVRYFATYQALLAEPLDVLFVAMSNHNAAEATMAGLAAGL